MKKIHTWEPENLTRGIELQAMNNIHPAMVDHYLALLRLSVGLGFHTLVTAIDGLLTKDDYLMAYHLAH